MKVIEKRALKGRLVDYYYKKGISVDVTNSANITLFSDVILTKKSKEVKDGYYMTSFGVKETMKLIHEVTK